MSSKCKYAKALSSDGWCRTASYYCTPQQEATCKHRAEYITNADHIRSLSDEELAEYLSNVYFGGFNDGLHRPPRVEQTLYTFDWLQREWTEQEG